MSFGSTGVLAIRNWIYLKPVFTHPRRFISWNLKTLELKVENGPIWSQNPNISHDLPVTLSSQADRTDCCEARGGQGIEEKELKALIFHLPARWQTLLSNSGWWLLHLTSTIARIVRSSNLLKLNYQR